MTESRERAERARSDRCPICRRPEDRCVCGIGVPVDNRVGVTILQHPGERHHPFNTARLARRALRNVDLRIVWRDADGSLLHRGSIPEDAALLYPSEHAVELSVAPRPGHLVVIDGTWAQAHTVYADNPWLRDLPHVRILPDAPSRYRIRREPAPDYLSTIESIACALRLLEPDTPGLDGLLDGFRAMMDTQADQEVERVRRRKVRGRPGLVERIATEWDRLWVGYAESTSRKTDGRRSREAPRLVQWAAVRVATGEVFDARIDPGVPLRYVPDLGAAGTVASLRADWSAVAGPSPLVACWSERAAELLVETTGLPVDPLSLRSAYGNLRGGVEGTLDAIVAREGRTAVARAAGGRAGERLGYAVALAELLRDRYRPAPRRD